MSVKIRMSRMGRRHRPFFRINAIDSRSPRDGRILEKLGHYDPIEKDQSKQIVLNPERIQYWLDKGAIPSDSVAQILIRNGIQVKSYEEKAKRREKAKAIARKKGKLFNEAERIAAEKAVEKEAAEKEAAEKAAAEAKVAAEKAAEEKAATAEKAAAAEKAEEDKAAEDKAADEKAAEDKAAEEKAAEDKAAEDKAAEDKAAEDKAAEDKAESEE